MRELRVTMGAGLLAFGLMTLCRSTPVKAAGGPDSSGSAYRVLKPVESGELTLFPVVRVGRSGTSDPFLTLDEGLRSGEVEITEAGSARGLVRSRGGAPAQYRGDQVNTLVLINHSKKPLLLLAGEIVTGGKQDRIVAGDRIVPADSDPVDLSVFCIEHGRWTPTSDKFGATAGSDIKSFMVQPEVRQQAMVAKNQQQVWNSVAETISVVNAAPMASPPSRVSTGVASVSSPGSTAQSVTVDGYPGNATTASPSTTSYAKTMQRSENSQKLDQVAGEATQARARVLDELKQEHAIGVVVAVHGEVIWADVFADTDLLTRYWTKLVRSYAAEGFVNVARRNAPVTEDDAQRFLDAPMRGAETSQGEVGIYRTLESHAGQVDQIVLESLLPEFTANVHISRLKVRGPAGVQPAMGIR